MNRTKALGRRWMFLAHKFTLSFAPTEGRSCEHHKTMIVMIAFTLCVPTAQTVEAVPANIFAQAATEAIK